MTIEASSETQDATPRDVTSEERSNPEQRDEHDGLRRALAAEREGHKLARRQLQELEASYQTAMSDDRLRHADELQKLQSERDELARNLRDMQQSVRRRQAIDKALSAAGDGFHVDEHTRPILEKVVANMPFDEKTIDATAKELVEAMKRPRPSGSVLRTPDVSVFGASGASANNGRLAPFSTTPYRRGG